MSDRHILQACTDAAQQPMGNDLLTERTDSATKQEVVALFSLPAELRNQIYQYVFQGWILAIRPSSNRAAGLKVDIWPETTSPYQIARGHTKGADTEPANVFGLLYTCRQIHAETRGLPYGMNTVLCGEKPFPPARLNDLKAHLTQVSSLQLCSYMPANIALSRTWLAILPYFSSLKSIEIHWQLRVPSWGSDDDNLSTATLDEILMEERISKATSTSCDISFHRTVIWG